MEGTSTMKTVLHRSFSRLVTALPAAAMGVWCLTGVASAAPALPSGGDGFAISLAASTSYPLTGQPVTLTATTNADVGPTPYYITIYSETTGAELAACGAGTSCSAAVSQRTAGTGVFEAFVGDNVPGEGRPGFVVVSSNEVPVTWWWFPFRGHRDRP
jgi:hypothetical protein